MGRKRKTRKEKVATSIKRQQEQQLNPFQYSLTTTLPRVSSDHPTHTREHISSAIIVKQDLKKTVIVSLALIALQFFLLFLLKQHALKIPGLLY